jgi:hypothetical protein
MMLRGKLQAKSVVKVYTVAMDSEQDAGPDLPDAEAPDIDTDVDTEPLQRSQDAIDQAREAAREALKDTGSDPTEPPESES